MSAETLGGASAPSAPMMRPSRAPRVFFRVDGDTLVPAAFATSPWGPVLHGRLIGGLTCAGRRADAGRGPRACLLPPDRRPVPLRAARAAPGRDEAGCARAGASRCST